MSALLLLLLAAAPSTRLEYEGKCLYCHSAEETESLRLTETGWRAQVEKMRRKAPLLIHKSDVPRLAAYLARTLKLLPASAGGRPKPTEFAEADAGTPPPPPLVTAPEEPLKVPEPEPPPRDDAALRLALEAETAQQLELDERGQSLLERRCSKCHTLGRVFTKLDSASSSLATLERMRRKTGSGISNEEAGLLERFLRSQF